jgi:hypothetical protein
MYLMQTNPGNRDKNSLCSGQTDQQGKNATTAEVKCLRARVSRPQEGKKVLIENANGAYIFVNICALY